MFENTGNDRQFLINVGRIADALDALEQHAARYLNDDTTLLDRLVVAEEENRRRLDELEKRIATLGTVVGP